MKTFIVTSVLLLIIQSCHLKDAKSIYGKPIEPFEKIKFNDGWEFKMDSGANWIPIHLPHTPRIEPLTVNDQWQGNLIYRKNLNIDENLSGKFILHFEGVMHESFVYVNNLKVSEHQGGYLPFSVDITDVLEKGQNEVRVEVSNTDNTTIPPGKPLDLLDFNFYGGIYRDAWLIRKSEIHFTDPFLENNKNAGWLIHFQDVSEEVANGTLRLEIENLSNVSKMVIVKAHLSIGEAGYNFEESINIDDNAKKQITLPINIKKPSLWSTTTPNLYDLSVEISTEKGRVQDRMDTKVGIRKIELNEDGFFLNSKKQFIRGTNRHQEYPYIGYAISNNANYRDALKIKNAGFDFVRLSHYPQDKSFLDACDELGIMVMNAIPGWQYFEEGKFIENAYQDIRDMVRRDRNHPSVIFWEVSLNESAMTGKFMKTANEILREELPFTDTYSAGWIDHASYDLFIPARQHAAPPYYWNRYKEGERKIFIAEYGDWEYYAHNAGFNQIAFEDLAQEERNSRQLRGAGERRLLQQAMNFQEAANSNRKGIGTIGHANWLMFDYNRGYSDDIEASGISDIFRIPKFAYYFYKSQRPPHEVIDHSLVEQGPMIKIANYWTETSPTNVKIFSNCEEVVLYLNDSLIAREKPEVNQFSDHLEYPPFEFQIDAFEPGKLLSVGLIDNLPVAKDSVQTPGAPVKLKLRIDTAGNTQKKEEDLIFVYAEVTDYQGNIIPTATNEVFFDLSGSGSLIGDNPAIAEAGIATILFKGDPSTLNIAVSSDELKPATFSNYLD